MKKEGFVLPPIFERPSPLLQRDDVVPGQVLDPLVQLLDAQLRQGLVRDEVVGKTETDGSGRAKFGLCAEPSGARRTTGWLPFHARDLERW